MRYFRFIRILRTSPRVVAAFEFHDAPSEPANQVNSGTHYGVRFQNKGDEFPSPDRAIVVSRMVALARGNP